MSETKKRKVHPPEFKAKVGLEALRGVRTINEIGQQQRRTGSGVDRRALSS